MTFQQLSGIDVILYFAPVVFASIFTTQNGAFLASGGSGIVLVVATVPAQIWVDKWGRKPPMVLGGAGMATCFIIIGSLFAAYGHKEGDQVILTTGPAKYAVVVLIYLFIALFSVTWAVVRGEKKTGECEWTKTDLTLFFLVTLGLSNLFG
jgi:MFS family permease